MVRRKISYIYLQQLDSIIYILNKDCLLWLVECYRMESKKCSPHITTTTPII